MPRRSGCLSVLSQLSPAAAAPESVEVVLDLADIPSG